MRTVRHHASGPAHVRVTADIVTVHASPKTTTASAVLAPLVDGDDTARERIDNAEIASNGTQFTVNLPDQPTSVVCGNGTTSFVSNGAATVIQSRSVNQVNTVSVGGTIITNGAVITSGNGVAHAATGAVEVVLDTPTESNLTAETTAGDITSHGELAEVDVDTTSGNIRLDRTTGDLRAEASSGNIAVSAAYGPIALEVSSGNITASELHRGGTLRVSSGNIRALLAGSTHPAHLKARVSSGNIDLATTGGASEGQLTWRASSGNVRVNGQKRPNRS